MTPRRFPGTRSTSNISLPVRLRRRVDADRDDSEAMSVLYDLHAERAFAVGWSILGTTAGAEAALAGAMMDVGRRRRSVPADRPTSAWVLGRASVHALRARRLGHGVPGRLHGLSESECQILALACAGRVSRTDIAAGLRLSSAEVASRMTAAVEVLRTSSLRRVRERIRRDGRVC